MDVKAVTEAIENYVRPATFPVGINYTAKFPAKYEAVWDIWGEKRPTTKE